MALPVPKASGEYRALTLFDAAPEGCLIFPARDHDSDPHLRFGEYGVVDTTNREPINGELYLIEWNSGRREFVQTWGALAPMRRQALHWLMGRRPQMTLIRRCGDDRTRGGTLTTCEGP